MAADDKGGGKFMHSTTAIDVNRTDKMKIYLSIIRAAESSYVRVCGTAKHYPNLSNLGQT